jgi:alkanesulfonate monooxygenase SsuD/methylene tetrahydromethanopterin reductase-like flavin-dependent oxidoreductase (luciferase family)
VHLGLILPNYDKRSSPDGIRATVEAAAENGFESVWTTEHIIVGPEGVDPYGREYDSIATLSWIAGWSELGLGTSIVLVPLHHPMLLAKQTATLQELSSGRFTLGIGVGWHEDEFRFMGVPFRHRGRRADEALHVIKALWSGAREFHGEFWSFENATFEPLPSPPPEIWVAERDGRASARGDGALPRPASRPARGRERRRRPRVAHRRLCRGRLRGSRRELRHRSRKDRARSEVVWCESSLAVSLVFGVGTHETCAILG